MKRWLDIELLNKEEILARSGQQLPRVGVYFLIKDREIVYVGKSINIPNRINEHRKHKVFDSVAAFECKQENLGYFELAYWSKFHPELNGNAPGLRPDQVNRYAAALEPIPVSRYFLMEDE